MGSWWYLFEILMKYFLKKALDEMCRKVKLKKTVKHSSTPEADVEEGGCWSKVTKLGKKL